MSFLIPSQFQYLYCACVCVCESVSLSAISHLSSSTHPFTPPAASTRSPRWRRRCWWSTARRTRSSTSPTAWRCTNAASGPWSRCGWRGRGTTMWSSTDSTWSASNSLWRTSWPTSRSSRTWDVWVVGGGGVVKGMRMMMMMMIMMMVEEEEERVKERERGRCYIMLKREAAFVHVSFSARQ